MKNPFSKPWTAAVKTTKNLTLLLTISLIACLPFTSFAAPVTIKGANGSVLDFAGLREANSSGVYLTVTEGQPEIFVEWASFDLDDLQTRQPSIYAAYKRLQAGEEPINLKLGIYKNLRSLETLIDQVNKEAAQEITLDVPPMTGFFDMSGFDSRYDRSNLNSIYSSWERRSKSYMREYERLLEEFFELTPDENKRSSWWYGSAERPKYTVITEIRPPRSSVRKPISHFLHYFADPRSQSNAMLITYLRANPKVHQSIAKVLDQQSRDLGSGTIMGEAHEITVLKANVDTVREHLHGMLKSTSLSADFQRDFERYIHTWKISKQT
ncbi:hypothetical protein QEH59_11090 [Coraliomargarita sp. SDUM461004]|uniref:Uncharacterized protein n=1 Tax=Thalassobacterium sedimentorum TaxID=3041258 RepID=A0ABU1AK01_9BACT|nr:hypothetical protein [Coraliomargarita sp. SDUM461004]MDQ8194974.1 hypothetical protein [Coraliomargarita sp. SDUM461004]